MPASTTLSSFTASLNDPEVVSSALCCARCCSGRPIHGNPGRRQRLSQYVYPGGEALGHTADADLAKSVLPRCFPERLYSLYTYPGEPGFLSHQHLMLSRKVGHSPLPSREDLPGCWNFFPRSSANRGWKTQYVLMFSISFLLGLSPLPVMKVLFIILSLVLTNGTSNLKPSSIILRTQPAFRN